jgi:hypothetical protein
VKDAPLNAKPLTPTLRVATLDSRVLLLRVGVVTLHVNA